MIYLPIHFFAKFITTSRHCQCQRDQHWMLETRKVQHFISAHHWARNISAMARAQIWTANDRDHRMVHHWQYYDDRDPQGYIIPKTVSHRWSRPLWYIIRLAAMIETRNGTSYWYYKPRIKATTAHHPTSQLSMIETYESTIKMWLKPGGYIPRSDDQRWRPYGRIITTYRSNDQCANSGYITSIETSNTNGSLH